jgi:hypothetical protein
MLPLRTLILGFLGITRRLEKDAFASCVNLLSVCIAIRSYGKLPEASEQLRHDFEDALTVSYLRTWGFP